ncbi:RNA-guided endonuclease TnpB family protein [Rhodococcus opacus]|uniref:Transposase n=1 Tax=Rhodococcus opacus TaxID=37919 RepID=A0A2S8IUA2_RHOOP|nr:RNA-guided endonuclease TnpB family protein [Rhodococcus opacus]PQP18340.1 transposase [Rhodococcus opacus]
MAGRVVKRAFKFRFYPTVVQADQLARTFGCTRYVYNRALAERSRAWSQEGRRVTYADTSKMLTGWKRDAETEWLAEPSKGPLQESLRQLQGAFERFWRTQSRYPQFKRMGQSKDSATYFSNCFTYRGGQVRLAKQSEPLDIRWSRPLPEGAAPSQVTVSRNARAKARLKVAKIHGRIADRRRDYLHKLSTRLVRENQVIAVEDLSVRNMVKNRSLSRAISDAGWSEFRSMLEYKADWYGRRVVAVDRFCPSSKTCSVCGEVASTMPLNVREWACRCGVVHDRDVNAARNILAVGLTVAACGDGVRPPRT